MVNDPSFVDMNYILQTLLQLLFTVDLLMKGIVLSDVHSNDIRW